MNEDEAYPTLYGARVDPLVSALTLVSLAQTLHPQLDVADVSGAIQALQNGTEDAPMQNGDDAFVAVKLENGLSGTVGNYDQHGVVKGWEELNGLLQALKISIEKSVVVPTTEGMPEQVAEETRQANRARLQSLQAQYSDPNRYMIVSLKVVCFDAELAAIVDGLLIEWHEQMQTRAELTGRVCSKLAILKSFTAQVVRERGCTCRPHMEHVNNDL